MPEYSPEQVLNAVNNVSAKNELLRGLNVSTIRLKFTDFGIVNPIDNKRVVDSFNFSDPVQKRVSEINVAMLEKLEKEIGVGLWLSPPGYYLGEYHETGKILVGARSYGDPMLYDITGQTFSAKEFASFMFGLSKYYVDGYYFLPDLDILEAMIPAPAVWAAIKNDQAEIQFNLEVQEDLEMDDPRRTYQERHGVDINDACQTQNEQHTTLKMIGPDGKIRTFVHACGVCQGEINDWLAPGDKCKHCGEIYLGVC